MKLIDIDNYFVVIQADEPSTVRVIFYSKNKDFYHEIQTYNTHYSNLFDTHYIPHRLRRLFLKLYYLGKFFTKFPHFQYAIFEFVK